MSGEIRPGHLYVVPTPIGNLEDITLRALRTLKEVALIAAEDTRKAKILLSTYAITTPTISLFEGNEQRRSEAIIARLKDDQAVAVISEAGMPGISDPGATLIRRCLDHGLEIDVLPGPSAVTTALVLSGLPAESFAWWGFLPRRGKARRARIDQLQRSRETIVIFESPLRTADTLAELAQALGEDRPAALTRELSKRHQQALRLPLGALATQVKVKAPRGEVTIVIAGAEQAELSEDELRSSIAILLEEGRSIKDVAEELGAVAGRRRVYQLALQIAKASAEPP